MTYYISNVLFLTLKWLQCVCVCVCVCERVKVVNMAKGNYVDCDSVTKYICLKYDKFVCNRKLNCSIPAPEDYPG